MSEDARETVLIVEDDPGIARLEARRLERAGYATALAATVEEARAAVRKDGIDLIVLDEKLSASTSGLEFYEELKATGFDLPAILVTGLSDEETLIRAIRAGLRDFVPKTPDFLDDLPPIVDRVMGQVRTERRLAESEARLAGIITTAMDGVLTIDGAETITLINPAAEQIFGIQASEAIGQPIQRFIPEWPCGEAVNPETAHALADHIEGTRLECDGARANGEMFPLEGSVSRVVVDRQAFRTLFVRDITARKQAEEERADRIRAETARAEAEAANLAKDRFLAVLSHELRTPLAPVFLAMSTILDEAEVPESIRSLLEMTRRNIQIEARLLDDLLDVTRITQGKLPLHREVIDAHDLIHQTIEICRKDIRDGGLELVLELDASETHVEADPARLQQVLWNLVKNAVKFTPPEGKITIRSRNQAGDGDGAECLVIEVSDTGIGIESGMLAKVFDPFEQGGATVTNRFGGLGLGLSISRSVAEAHGGQLTVSSAGRDRGSTFTLILTTATASESRPSRPVRPSQDGESLPIREILLVEDDPDTSALLSRMLRRRGFQVTTADCVAAAWRKAEVGPFDLVICDIGLPDGSGLELMQRLQARFPVKGIVLSGYGREDDVQQSKDAGFVGHLTKPVDFQALEAMIRRISHEVPGESGRSGSEFMANG